MGLHLEITNAVSMSVLPVLPAQLKVKLTLPRHGRVLR